LRRLALCRRRTGSHSEALDVGDLELADKVAKDDAAFAGHAFLPFASLQSNLVAAASVLGYSGLEWVWLKVIIAGGRGRPALILNARVYRDEPLP
jgi:hypothetical protein